MYIELVLIPAGEFMMGSALSPEETARKYGGEARSFADEHPRHRVRITKPFYLGKYEVTQAQWAAVTGASPWSGGPYAKEEPRHAASCVDWSDAEDFLSKLPAGGVGGARLPTEAEWEYACRGGTTTPFSFGADVALLNDHAWYDENAWDIGEKCAHGVGLKRPNAWGLYDMHGNVLEWCLDGKRYYTSSDQTDPRGPSGGSRVLRGGSWGDDPRGVRCAVRDDHDNPYGPHSGRVPRRVATGGFRVLFRVPSAR